MPAIEPAARAAGTLNPADHLLPLRAVLHVDAQDSLGLVGRRRRAKTRTSLLVGRHLADLVIEDEPLVLEDLDDILLQTGGRHIEGRALDTVSIADSRQQVRDR